MPRGSLFGFELPEKIINVHRRRFPRVDAPDGSTATFNLPNRTRATNCTIVDISLEGAKLIGDIPSTISKGDTISPVTIKLFFGAKADEEKLIQVAEAKAIWSKMDEGRTQELGLHFTLQQSQKKILTDYIDIRSIEDLH